VGVLEALPAGISGSGDSRRPEIEAPLAKRVGNGVVQRAVVGVFLARGGPMTVAEACRAAEVVHGSSLSRDSVNSSLSTGARGPMPRFARVARGRYRLVLYPPAPDRR